MPPAARPDDARPCPPQPPARRLYALAAAYAALRLLTRGDEHAPRPVAWRRRVINLVARADALWWERVCGLRRRVILSAPDAEYVRHDRFIIACFPHHLIWPAASHIVSLQLTHEVNAPATEAARARSPVLDATHVPRTWTAGTDDEARHGLRRRPLRPLPPPHCPRAPHRHRLPRSLLPLPSPAFDRQSTRCIRFARLFALGPRHTTAQADASHRAPSARPMAYPSQSSRAEASR